MNKFSLYSSFNTSAIPEDACSESAAVSYINNLLAYNAAANPSITGLDKAGLSAHLADWQCPAGVVSASSAFVQSIPDVPNRSS